MADDDEEDVFPAKDSAEAASVSERTVTIIRPEALKAHKEDILNEIAEAGFQIVRQKEIQLTREQAEHSMLLKKMKVIMKGTVSKENMKPLKLSE